MKDIARQEYFIPPFCPQETCKNHCHPRKDFYFKHGWIRNKKSRLNRRYQCKDCLKTFCYSYFQLQYKEKKSYIKNSTIFKYLLFGASFREIGRNLHCSERLVRRRTRKMHCWALLRHSELIKDLQFEEALVMDGLENFSFSQYDPNNINHVVGKKSLFIYDWNFSPMNRKGRMSDRQKGIKKELEAKYGKYQPNAIRHDVKRILLRCLDRSKNLGELVLYSDKHFQYRKAIQIDLKNKPIFHHTTSSKAFRCYKNNLFAVNNTDLIIRQQMGAFRRETIAFAKHPPAMMERYGLYTVWKNYLRPQFTKEHKLDPTSNKKSPAMAIGVVDKIFSFQDFFDYKRTPTQIKLNTDFKNFYDYKSPHIKFKVA